MKALRAHSRGGPESLVYEEAPRPSAGQGEVVVAVAAAAITFAELSWDLTWQTLSGEDRTPTIPSHELCGTVVELGPGVDQLSVGDRIYGLIPFDRNGAAAEFVATGADELALAPVSATDVEAAVLPLAAMTAWQALAGHAKVEPGEHVLVLGGAGGVGVYAVQLAAELGARVTATAIPADADFILGLGARRTIDVATEGLGSLSDVDVVIDTIGGDVLAAAYGVVRLGGRLVTLGGPPSDDRARAYGVEAIFFVVEPSRDDLVVLAGLVDDGSLRPVLSQTFALADGRTAYESGPLPRPPGKTALTVS
jgi:NADPH:quinone reductase-like Zn-dependent oxidoreductase